MISWSPTDYRLKVFQRSLASLKENTKRPHTLVLVDNGVNGQKEFVDGQDIDILIRPKVNLGVGLSRNVGAGTTDTKYLAFVDNDIEFHEGWLNKCIETLEKYENQKLIATGVRNHPMKFARNRHGKMDGYEIWNRCAGMCMVMRRSDYEALGKFDPNRTNVGARFCLAVKNKKYKFIWHPSWTGRHLTKSACFHYKKQQFLPETGEWVDKESILKESN